MEDSGLVIIFSSLISFAAGDADHFTQTIRLKGGLERLSQQTFNETAATSIYQRTAGFKGNPV